MDIRKYLTEARLPSIDKRKLIKLINTGPAKKDESIELSDGTKIRVLKGDEKSLMTFIYPSDNFELTDALVDIIDARGRFDFDSKVQKGNQIFEVRVA